MSSALTGQGTAHSWSVPAEVEAVEAAVNKLYLTEPDSRKMILLHYLANGTKRQKMKYLRVSSYTYYQRLERAEYAIKIELGY